MFTECLSLVQLKQELSVVVHLPSQHSGGRGRTRSSRLASATQNKMLVYILGTKQNDMEDKTLSWD